MGDGTEIPRDLRPGTRDWDRDSFFLAHAGLGLIFEGQSREVTGPGLEIPRVRDTKIPRDSGFGSEISISGFRVGFRLWLRVPKENPEFFGTFFWLKKYWEII